jgi:hypothetical protein
LIEKEKIIGDLLFQIPESAQENFLFSFLCKVANVTNSTGLIIKYLKFFNHIIIDNFKLQAQLLSLFSTSILNSKSYAFLITTKFLIAKELPIEIVPGLIEFMYNINKNELFIDTVERVLNVWGDFNFIHHADYKLQNCNYFMKRLRLI